MTVHPVRSAETLRPPQQSDTTSPAPSSEADPAADTAAVYDSTWAPARGETTAPGSSSFEQMMVSGGKIYVVLAVVLIIWFGLVTLLLRTDRRIARLEDKVEAQAEGDG
jgi:hypothetical protein